MYESKDVFFVSPERKISWNVPAFDLKKYLLSGEDKKFSSTGSEVKAEHLNYTVTNPDFVFHNMHELAELLIATGKGNLNDLVSYRPERILLHYVIATVIMRIQLTPLNKEEEQALEHRAMLQRVISQVYDEIKNKSQYVELVGKLYAYRAEVRAILINISKNESMPPNTSPLLEALCREILNTCKAQIKSNDLGQHVDGYTVEQAIIDLATNRIYKIKANEGISKLINEFIDAYVQAGVYDLFEIPQPKERNLFILVGGAASGKGSACANLRYNAEKQSIEWINISKGGSDNFKQLLEPPGALREIADQLVANEASYITWNIIKNMQLDAANNLQAPHIFSEQLGVSQYDDMIALGLINDGMVKVIAVSTKVEEAIERAYARGQEMGRYIPSESILAGHKSSTETLPLCMAHYAGKKVQFLLIDNNGVKGSNPVPFAQVDCLTKAIIITDREKFNEFIKKIAIKVKAQNPDEVYDQAILSTSTIENYLAPCLEKQFTIVDSPTNTLKGEFNA